MEKSNQKQPSREEIAQREIGQTEITHTQAMVLSLFFLCLITLVPLTQAAHEMINGGMPHCLSLFSQAKQAKGPFFRRAYRANSLLLQHINKYVDELEESSLLNGIISPYAQLVLTGLFKAGNEQAYTGRHGRLFYRPDVDYLTGKPFLAERELATRRKAGSEWETAHEPDPRIGILDFKRQLDKRGIQLIVVVAPPKSALCTQSLYPKHTGHLPLNNPSFAQFKRELQAMGIPVYYAATTDRDAATRYLETDTHWHPETVEAVAKTLADFAKKHADLSELRATSYELRQVDVSNHGDIVRMLGLPTNQSLYPSQQVTIHQVLRDNYLWRPQQDADILLLGDSFSNIYSLESMGWGESAGLAEQLSYELQRPLDTIVRNDSGAHTTRRILTRELARGNNRLAGKKLVIWQFAARELSGGDWRPLPLELGEGREAKFFIPQPGRPVEATGVIEKIAPAPLPKTSPYKDHIVTAHLVSVARTTNSRRNKLSTRDSGATQDNHALVYLWSMRDDSWTEAARYRPGQKVRLLLKNWNDVEENLDGIKRSELDGDIMLEDACWGEIIR